MRPMILLCGMLLMTASTALAQTIDTGVPQTIPDARVAEAKALLDGAKIGTRFIGATHAVLAVWRVGSDEPVRKINVWKGASQDPTFTVRVIRGGGVGTVYAVTEPAGYETLAFRMNVSDPTGRPWFKAVTVVTVTDALADDLRVAEGLRYLTEVTDAARARLDERRVCSVIHGCTKDPVAPHVPKLALMSIVIVERVAPEIAAGAEPVAAIRRVLTAFAVNRGDAFDFAKSRVGATGAYQFMRGTYSGTRGTYRRARLDPNFRRGMGDHVNAAMAQTCLADRILSKLTRRQLQRFVDAGPEEVGAYVAAAYNGGDVYALRAIRRHPDAWDAEHSWRIDRKRPGLLRPTTHYVAVFRTVYRFLRVNTPG